MAYSVRSGKQAIARWTNTEFAWVLFLAQLIALIPLSHYLIGLDWQVAITYILIPMGFVVYSRVTQDQVRAISVKDMLLYGVAAFWITALLGYILYTFILHAELGTTTRPEIWGVIATQMLFVAPSEELAFRFIIPQWLGKKLGPRSSKWTAAVIAASLFALFHYSAYSGSWSSILIAFAIGMIWAGAYYKWGIGATMGSHAAYNLLVSGILTGNLTMVVGGL